MKSAILLSITLTFAILTHAQTPAPVVDPDRITVTVSNDTTITLAFQHNVLVLRSNTALDSCLKKIIPTLNRPYFFLDLPNDMDQEKRRTIGVILEKFHCPVTGFRKF